MVYFIPACKKVKRAWQFKQVTRLLLDSSPQSYTSLSQPYMVSKECREVLLQPKIHHQQCEIMIYYLVFIMIMISAVFWTPVDISCNNHSHYSISRQSVFITKSKQIMLNWKKKTQPLDSTQEENSTLNLPRCHSLPTSSVGPMLSNTWAENCKRCNC